MSLQILEAYRIPISRAGEVLLACNTAVIAHQAACRTHLVTNGLKLIAKNNLEDRPDLVMNLDLMRSRHRLITELIKNVRGKKTWKYAGWNYDAVITMWITKNWVYIVPNNMRDTENAFREFEPYAYDDRVVESKHDGLTFTQWKKRGKIWRNLFAKADAGEIGRVQIQANPGFYDNAEHVVVGPFYHAMKSLEKYADRLDFANLDVENATRRLLRHDFHPAQDECFNPDYDDVRHEMNEAKFWAMMPKGPSPYATVQQAFQA